LQTLVSGAIVD